MDDIFALQKHIAKNSKRKTIVTLNPPKTRWRADIEWLIVNILPWQCLLHTTDCDGEVRKSCVAGEYPAPNISWYLSTWYLAIVSCDDGGWKVDERSGCIGDCVDVSLDLFALADGVPGTIELPEPIGVVYINPGNIASVLALINESKVVRPRRMVLQRHSEERLDQGILYIIDPRLLRRRSDSVQTTEGQAEKAIGVNVSLERSRYGCRCSNGLRSSRNATNHGLVYSVSVTLLEK